MDALRQVILSLTATVCLSLSILSASAQRRPCVRDGAEPILSRAAQTRAACQGAVNVPIILAAYSDVGFSKPDIRNIWDAMANLQGFAENGAVGCVADYFREQSMGKLDITFDVIGPVTLSQPRSYYGENIGGKDGDDRRPGAMVSEACDSLAATVDFSRYDWDGDGTVDAVIVVYAGQGENMGGPPEAIWPHMSSISHTVGDARIRIYACVNELAANGSLYGFGTLCHEFSHCIGLPDLYPTSGDVYSIFDQWDLMDGGNYANYGWSPPSYSAFERHLLGWLQYEELSSPATIQMKPSSREPRGLVIRNDAHPSEYFLLENRKQEGFDTYLPGEGLLVTHVIDYTGSLAPNTDSRTQVALVAADNRSYEDYDNLYPYEYGEDGRNNYLCQAAYPWIDGERVNDLLTDNSTPSTLLKNKNTDGTHQLGKPITNIRRADDGTITFDFMQPDALTAPTANQSSSDKDTYYDLQGRPIVGRPVRHGIYLCRGRKVVL